MPNTTAPAPRRPLYSDDLPRLRSLRSVLNDTRGLGLVEFALVLPLMLFVYVMAVGFSDIMMVRNRVVNAAYAVAYTSAMDSSITNAEAAAILAAGRALLSPVEASSSIILSSVGPNGAKNGYVVRWSDGLGASGLAVGSAFVFPSGAAGSFGAVSNKPVQVALVTVNYTSTLASIWNSLPWKPFDVPVVNTMSEQAYALPLASGGAEWTARVP